MAAIRTQREIRQRAPWWFFGLLALNVALMTYDARDESTKQRKIRTVAQSIAYPIQRGASSVGNFFGGLFGGFGELRRASVENQQLRAQVEQMQTELRDTRQKAAQADRLEKLLSLTQQSSYQTVTAQVMLVTDEKSGAGAVVGQLGTSNAAGSIKGMGENGLLDMRYVSGLEKVQMGDTVYTTGQDGIYPAGLTVGQVVELRPGSATQPQVIHIRPSAGLDRLKEVTVLQYRPAKNGQLDQSLPNVDKKKQ